MVKVVEGLPDNCAGYRHVIVLITHAAFLRSNFAHFAGWRIVIDEAPAFLDFEEKVTHLDADYFEQHYRLEEVSEHWHSVSPTIDGTALTVADVRADDSHAHLSNFHARVLEAHRPDSRRHVLCNLPDWSAMQNRKVKWCWASAFSFLALAAFERVEVLGNRFRSDIGSLVTQFFDGDDVEWVQLPPIDRPRAFQARTVDIRYFSERSASKSFFSSPEGQSALREIGRYLREALPIESSIWTANDISTCAAPTPRSLLNLEERNHLPLRQAGTNRHKESSHAAIIYAAKPAPNLQNLLNTLGIETDAWTRSTEHEAILQFVTRTSVRDPLNAQPTHLFVFDRDQADYLAAYFAELPYTDVDVSKVDVPLEVLPRNRGGRPRVSRTPEEQSVWIAERRRRDRERKRSVRARRPGGGALKTMEKNEMFSFGYSGLDRDGEDYIDLWRCEYWCRENLEGPFSLSRSGILISSKYDAATYALGPWNHVPVEIPPHSYSSMVGVWVPFRKYMPNEINVHPPSDMIDLSSFPDGGALFYEFEQHLTEIAIGRFHMSETGIWFASESDAAQWVKFSAPFR